MLIVIIAIASFVIPSPSGATYGQDFLDWVTGLTAAPSDPLGPIKPGEQYYGNVQFIINRVDHLAGGAVTPTSDAYSLFHQEPYQGLGAIAITPAGTTTEVNREDQGYVWMSLNSGDDFYLIEDAFLAANSRIKQHYWKDYDNDGEEEYIIKMYVGDIAQIGTAQTPTATLSLPLLDEDVASYSDDNPSDIASIGTSEVVQTVTWKLSGITAEDGAFLTRLYFATNSTRGGDDVRLEEVTLSGGWVTSSGAQTYYASPVKEENGDYEAWYINPQDYLEYNQGQRIWRDTNEADTLYIDINVRCTFESGDAVLLDIYADFLDPDGSSVTQVNDQVMLSA
jgi:hypothetical protein